MSFKKIIITKEAFKSVGLYIYPKIEVDLEHQNLRKSTLIRNSKAKIM